jgi:TfoX/Sxy family transcriptional regulator of competence genes
VAARGKEEAVAYNEGLAQRIREAFGDLHSGAEGLVEKQMFGGIGFMVLGNMACGVNKEDLIIRVGPASYEKALDEPYTRPFDLTGRPMKGWVVVTGAGYQSEADLQRWVKTGVEFALSLPPK